MFVFVSILEVKSLFIWEEEMQIVSTKDRKLSVNQ